MAVSSTPSEAAPNGGSSCIPNTGRSTLVRSRPNALQFVGQPSSSTKGGRCETRSSGQAIDSGFVASTRAQLLGSPTRVHACRAGAKIEARQFRPANGFYLFRTCRSPTAPAPSHRRLARSLPELALLWTPGCAQPMLRWRGELDLAARDELVARCTAGIIQRWLLTLPGLHSWTAGDTAA